MGINGLTDVLSDYPHLLQSDHLSNYQGYRFAIDISIFLYKFIRSEKLWINKFIEFLNTLKTYSIRAVCIFDGDYQPPEKKEEQIRRREESAKTIKKLERLRIIYKKLKSQYVHTGEDIPLDLLEEIKSLITKKRKTKKDKVINYDDIQDIMEGIRETIDRWERQTIAITQEHKNIAIEAVKVMGLVYIVSDTEAETLCSYLCLTGQVDAVLSEDSDVLAYGTPLLITKLNLYNHTIVPLYLPRILEDLGLEKHEFKDLCILLGCDYNDRVKGYPPDGKKRKKPIGIGVKGAWHMINEYRTLEIVEEYVEDITPLNYQRCRQLFSIPKDMQQQIIPQNNPIDEKILETFLKKHKCNIRLNTIMDNFRPPKLIFEDDNDEVEVLSEEEN